MRNERLADLGTWWDSNDNLALVATPLSMAAIGMSGQYSPTGILNGSVRDIVMMIVWLALMAALLLVVRRMRRNAERDAGESPGRPSPR